MGLLSNWMNGWMYCCLDGLIGDRTVCLLSGWIVAWMNCCPRDRLFVLWDDGLTSLLLE